MSKLTPILALTGAMVATFALADNHDAAPTNSVNPISDNRFTIEVVDQDYAGTFKLSPEISIGSTGANPANPIRIYYGDRPMTKKDGYCFLEGFKGSFDEQRDWIGFGASKPHGEWYLDANVGGETDYVGAWGRCVVFKKPLEN